MTQKEFGEGNGCVHLMSALNAEYTLCGDAFDVYAGSDGKESGVTEDISKTNKKVVTCPRCIAEIENCRGVRIK